MARYIYRYFGLIQIFQIASKSSLCKFLPNAVKRRCKDRKDYIKWTLEMVDIGENSREHRSMWLELIIISSRLFNIDPE